MDYQKTPWHALPVENALTTLRSNLDHGLLESEAAERLKHYGSNELKAAEGVSPWEILLGQFKNVLIVILLIAVGLSAVLGHEVEAIAIGIIVLFAVILGFVQEYRAERAIEALRKMAAPTATVLRDGEEREIAARDIVPGDIVYLTAGDRVPADGRVAESVNLHADEASLTGESVPVAKKHDPLPEQDLAIGDRHNMLFAGTNITYGRGCMIVTETGMQTEFGKIAGMLQEVKDVSTPLQRNLDQVGKRLAQGAFVIVALIVGVGLLRSQPLLDMFIFGVALAVAVVPEALPAVVTISLAIGVQRMVKRHALIRHLPAVETLGSTTVICSDKTGTLTRDEMTLRKIRTAEETFEVTGSGYDPHGDFVKEGRRENPPAVVQDLLAAGTLASDAHLTRSADGAWTIKGDPTEGAFVVAAAKAGLQKDQLDEASPRTAEIPFTSESKRMITLHKTKNGMEAYAKGAPEIMVESCTHIRTTAGDIPFSVEAKAGMLDFARTMADDALRVLGVATKKTSDVSDAEHGLTFLGLAGMIDPPRTEAFAAVRRCEDAGIRVVMITGDHPVTARAVARELGILRSNRVMTGSELEAINDEEFEAIVEEIDVFARVSPIHKLRVVTALQKHGQIVAMTGDGVNDAPALKRADVGIAMGIAGTDVSREASDMTLTDDNFASIVAAVEEGRGIFGNIKKYLMYLLSSNVGEILLMAASAALGLPLPLTAVQILYVNLATDGFPALALAVDPMESDVMARRPRRAGQGILTRSSAALLVAGGAWTAVANVVLFAWLLHSGRTLETAMTMTFATLVVIQFANAYIFRSERHSFLRGMLRNRWLNLAVIWEMALLAALFYVPFLQTAFSTVPLRAGEWLLVLATSATIIPVMETVKALSRRGVFGHVE